MTLVLVLVYIRVHRQTKLAIWRLIMIMIQSAITKLNNYKCYLKTIAVGSTHKDRAMRQNNKWEINPWDK